MAQNNEIWKDIPEYPGYQVSNIGNVRSFLNNRHGIGNNYHILKPAIDKHTGYWKVSLNGRTVAIHRLVADAFCEGKKYGYDVNHIDGNKLNNDCDNLEWCTRSDNMRHAFKMNLRTPTDASSKPVRIVETGEVFKSIRDCAKAIDGRGHTISMCVYDKYDRTKHKELHFELVTDDEYDQYVKSKQKPFLYPHQKSVIPKIRDGCILNGGVGSGKSRTSLYYYFTQYGGRKETTDEYIPMKNPRDLYIITTARKRDTCDWSREMLPFLINTDPEINYYDNKVVIDSWNNIKKYKDVYGAFFIFDEDRVTGSGVWVKAFLKIARKNRWIILSATPGDSYMDYVPVFVANGFYKNKTDFVQQHVIYSRFTKYPKIDRYVDTHKLERLKRSILIEMKFDRHTVPHHEDVYVKYDIHEYRELGRSRWNPYKNEPIKNAAELCYLWRKVVNSDVSRQIALLEIFEDHPKMIIFYNFDYELDILKTIFEGTGVTIAAWNGHVHEPIPTGDTWVYLVQYAANEGWNCITTDTIVFFSQTYSYKTLVQAAGRIDRLNTPFKDLYYYHLKTRSGIDLAISRALKEKKNFNEAKYTKWQ